MTHPWQLTPEQFHGVLTPTNGQDGAWSAGMAMAADECLRAASAARPEPLYSDSYYRIVAVNEPGDFVVIDVAGAAVGAKIGSTIAVAPEHRNKGLGTEIVLAAWYAAPWPIGTVHQVSHDGARLLKSAHRKSCLRAFADNAPVLETNIALYTTFSATLKLLLSGSRGKQLVGGLIAVLAVIAAGAAGIAIILPNFPAWGIALLGSAMPVIGVSGAAAKSPAMRITGFGRALVAISAIPIFTTAVAIAFAMERSAA